MEIKRVGIYCRVSTKDQNAENQVLDLRRYCDSRGWEVADQQVDECEDQTPAVGKRNKNTLPVRQSGLLPFPWATRPAINNILRSACEAKIDAILFYSLNDFFPFTFQELLWTEEELRCRNIALVFLKEDFDTSHYTGRFKFQTLLSVNQFMEETTCAK